MGADAIFHCKLLHSTLCCETLFARSVQAVGWRSIEACGVWKEDTLLSWQSEQREELIDSDCKWRRVYMYARRLLVMMLHTHWKLHPILISNDSDVS